MHSDTSRSDSPQFPDISIKDLIYWFVGTVFIFLALSLILFIGTLIFGDLTNQRFFSFAWLISLFATGISGLAFIEGVNAAVLQPRNFDWWDL